MSHTDTSITFAVFEGFLRNLDTETTGPCRTKRHGPEILWEAQIVV